MSPNVPARPKARSKGASTQRRSEAAPTSRRAPPRQNSTNTTLRSQGPVRGPAIPASRPRGAARIKPAQSSMMSAAAQVARAISLPLEHHTRFPDAWSQRPTATATPFQITSNDWSQNDGSLACCKQGGNLFAISRDPLNSFVTIQSNSNWTEELYFSRPVASLAGLFNEEAAFVRGYPILFDNDETYHLAPAYSRNPTTGDVIYTVVASDTTATPNLKWFWHDNRAIAPGAIAEIRVKFYLDESATIQMPSDAAASPGDLNLFFHDGFHQEPHMQSSINNGTLGWPTTFFVYTSGYFALDVASFGIRSLSRLFITIELAGFGDHLLHLPLAGLSERATDFESVRVVGKSLMISPESTEVARGGAICGVQLPEGELPTTLVPFNNVELITARINSRQDAQQLDFAHGMYCYLTPTSPECFEFQRPFRYLYQDQLTKRPVVVGYQAQMHPPGGWAVIAVQAAANSFSGTIPFPGALVRVTIADSLEFNTTSLWYQLAHCDKAVLDPVLVARLLKGIPNFTENPFHFRDITNWIKRNSGALKRAFAAATSVGSIFIPEAAPLFGGLNSAVQSA